jgi:hypothetical protein
MATSCDNLTTYYQSAKCASDLRLVVKAQASESSLCVSGIGGQTSDHHSRCIVTVFRVGVRLRTCGQVNDLVFLRLRVRLRVRGAMTTYLGVEQLALELSVLQNKCHAEVLL